MANAHKIQRTLESAVVAFQNGDLDGAAGLCSGLLSKHPRNSNALHILGAIRLRQNDPQTALTLLEPAAKADPRNSEILGNLGAAYRAAGNVTQAVSVLKKAARINPRNISALLNLGNAASEAGEPDLAIDAYRKLLAFAPGHLGARHALAEALHRSDQKQDALAEFEILEQTAPDDPDLLNHIGTLLAETGNRDRAEHTLREARRLAPDNDDIIENLANVLAVGFRIEDAIDLYEQVAERSPDNPELLCNLGNTLSRGGRPREAEDKYRLALSMDQAHADAHASLANNLLADAKFGEGWKHYLHRPSTRKLTVPLHREALPQDLTGKQITVLADQGLGDQIFFARFFPELRKRGAVISYRTDNRLAGVMTRSDIGELIAEESGTEPPDFVVSAGDLPFLLRHVDADRTPPPYAIPSLPERVERLRNILTEFGPPPWVGITWRAGTANNRLALSKEIPASHLAAAVSDISGSLIVIQRGIEPDELAAFSQDVGRPVLDLSGLNDDLEDLLAISGLLDRYVGVSNTMTHLRAASGRTSDVLVPIPAEFRWMSIGETTPWFEGCRIYRQSPDGSWSSACTALSQTLNG